MSFAPIQEDVDRYISQFKEGYFPPLSMLARLTEELGDVAYELCDVIFVAVCLANSLHIDLDAAFARAMQKYYVRDKDRWTRKN
jgi:NTP pyrophosphatase (non-canonical NTP hydrolase)